MTHPNPSSKRFLSAAATSLALIASPPAMAWGDEGHEIVAEVAMHFLQPDVRTKVMAMLAADQDPLTAHDVRSEATWADKFREASDANRTATRQWHFVDIEISAPDLATACFGMPALPPGSAATAGPAADCAVDKIDEFAAELSAPGTVVAERLLALKFVLHFVGDIHQPLHSSDAMDQGGNLKPVSAVGLGAGNLHAFWDTQFVQRLGTDPVAIGDGLASHVSVANATVWAQGTPADWSMEAFAVARSQVYGKLPRPGSKGIYALPATYVDASKAIVTLQLSRAGVRLAAVLNKALASL